MNIDSSRREELINEKDQSFSCIFVKLFRFVVTH